MWEVLQIVLWVILGLLGAFVLYVAFACVCSLFVDKNKDYPKDSKFFRFFLDTLTGVVLFFSSVKIHVKGKEKLPEGRFLMVSNHRSGYDALSTWYAFRECQLACVSKPSNFKIPFFSRITKRCCFMAIDRDSAKNAVKTINYASEVMINDQVSVLVYPEGTRSKTGELLPFHNMVFRMAQKAQVPIVVCTIRGTEKIKGRAPFRRTDVYIEVVDVLPVEEVVEKRTNELGDKISGLMLDNLSQAENQK